MLSEIQGVVKIDIHQLYQEEFTNLIEKFIRRADRKECKRERKRELRHQTSDSIKLEPESEWSLGRRNSIGSNIKQNQSQDNHSDTKSNPFAVLEIE